MLIGFAEQIIDQWNDEDEMECYSTTIVQGCIFVWPLDFLRFLSDDILDFNLDRA